MKAVIGVVALLALSACSDPTSPQAQAQPTNVATVATPQAPPHDTAARSNDAYLDDRSTAPAIINSYYNAINRKEYARAWSYRGEGSDVQAYDVFKKGFANTKTADVRLGEAVSEGAAGSTYTTVPTGLSVTNEDGTREFFAGCYTTHLSQPAIQDMVPFKPMSIRKATMAKVADEAAMIAATSKPCESN